MSDLTHRYEVDVRWTGNLGSGTAGYRAYSRSHEVSGPGKTAAILCSSDPAYGGDAARYNPEELLVASLSACHMLWVLHLCADAGIVVTAYADRAIGTMKLEPDGSGRFAEVTLYPRLTITDANRIGETVAIHEQAHRMCFVASSVNFPVRHRPEVWVG